MGSDSEITIPASTLVIVREAAAGAPELLMLERSGGMRFAAGALVFPGGRVDDADMQAAERLATNRPETIDDLAARIASIRETIEETGIAIGFRNAPDAPTIAMMRTALSEGADFGRLVEEAGLALDLDTLAPFARWQPPKGVAHKRFDARFYLAAAPADAIADPDGTENVGALWASADAILQGSKAGRHMIIFPTICTLYRLAQFGSFSEIAQDAERFGHHLAATEIIPRDGGNWYTVPHDIGYPVHSLLDGVLPPD